MTVEIFTFLKIHFKKRSDLNWLIRKIIFQLQFTFTIIMPINKKIIPINLQLISINISLIIYCSRKTQNIMITLNFSAFFYFNFNALSYVIIKSLLTIETHFNMVNNQLKNTFTLIFVFILISIFILMKYNHKVAKEFASF